MIQLDKNTGKIYFEDLILSPDTSLDDILTITKDSHKYKLKEVSSFYVLGSINNDNFFISVDLSNSKNIHSIAMGFNYTKYRASPLHIQEKSKNELIKLMNQFQIEENHTVFSWGNIGLSYDIHNSLYLIEILYNS